MVLYQHELSADVKRIIIDLNCKYYSNWFRLGRKGVTNHGTLVKCDENDQELAEMVEIWSNMAETVVWQKGD